MQEITLQDGIELIAVEVDFSAHADKDLTIASCQLDLLEEKDTFKSQWVLSTFDNHGKVYLTEVGKEPDTFTLLGTATDFLNSPDAESRCRDFVAFGEDDNEELPYGFRDYTGNRNIYYSAVDSLESALQVMGITPDKYSSTILIVKSNGV